MLLSFSRSSRRLLLIARLLLIHLLALSFAWPMLAGEVGCPGNSFLATTGDDVIDGSSDPPTTDCRDNVRAWSGNDLVRALGEDDIVNGGPGDDRLYGDDGDDLLAGAGGNDQLFGGPGNDHLKGESDDDQLFGEDGDDILEGFSKNDYLDGGSGNNSCDGLTDDDTIVGRSGVGLLRGGADDDFIVIVGNSLANYEVDGDRPGSVTGDDLLFFARDANPDMVKVEVINGKAYRQLKLDLRTALPVEIDLADVHSVEAVITGDGDDRLIGTDDASGGTYESRLREGITPILIPITELFFSGAGDDVIDTKNGGDFVDAGDGDDVITLGTGAHYLIGGGGRDTWIWPEGALSGSQASILTDLEVGDKVQLLGVGSADIGLTSTPQDGEVATTVSVQGQERILLHGVEPSAVRIQRLRNGLQLEVLQTLPRQRPKSIF